MTENARTAAVIKGQLSKFSGIIAKRLSKAKQRLVREMLYGIQASKDIKLSNITRSLNEPIPFIKTEDRLSRNLDDEDFTEEINNQICRLGSAKVLDDMVIAIDPGDIRKKHASKMECLCTIHDGSEHELGKGYWLAKAVAADIEHKTVIPLYLEAYSHDAEDFKSENDQLFKVIDTVGASIGNKGIYAIDREETGASFTTSSSRRERKSDSSSVSRPETSSTRARGRTASCSRPCSPVPMKPSSSRMKTGKNRR